MKLSEFKEKVIKEYGEEEWKKIENSYVYEAYSATEEEQIEAVKQDGYVIQCINNPSEEMQLIAVKNNGNNITEINNPTDKVIQEAIKKIDINNTYNLKYMLRHIENDLKQESEEQTIKLSELKNMTLEQIKELLNKNIKEETNE
jgi:hypothetical protein